jgi:3-methyl-2-oxobutanoate hydroxymethyltransferase
MKKLTVLDLLEGKAEGKKFSYVHVASAEQALAAQTAGIDMMGCAYNEASHHYPTLASNTHFQFGMKYGKHASATEALRDAFKAMEAGAQSVYCAMSFDVVSELAKQGIPVVGHVGLVPPKCTWTGGFKAVGKTSVQAMQIFNAVKSYENAGAMGVEIEVIPHQLASEISKRTSLLTISLGAGAGCDVQYLFSNDLLGETQGHIPRHAKVYHDMNSEYEKLQQIRINAYSAFINDLHRGEFPASQHLVEMPEQQFNSFIEQVDKQN